MSLDKWVPLFSKLVWPAVIVGVVGVYRDEAGTLIQNVTKAIGEGRSVEVPGILKVGERTSIGELVSMAPADVGKNIDLSVDAVGGFEEIVRKGDSRLLDQLQQRLRESPGKTIDILVLAAGQQYSPRLMSEYIASLGIRYVVFQDGERFAGWMDAGLFNSQLPKSEQEQWLPYNNLRSDLVGLHEESVPSDTSALDVLKKMEEEKVDSIAVVDAERLKSIVSREGIIAKLLVASIVKPKQDI
jgi:hypothetical protein